jgi:hypothetical protein
LSKLLGSGEPEGRTDFNEEGSVESQSYGASGEFRIVPKTEVGRGLSLIDGNHRDIMAIAKTPNGSPFAFLFMQLPEDLQDEVIEGLDTNSLTFKQATEMIRERSNVSISYESIRRYYVALQNQRRMFELDYIVKSMIQKYSEIDPRESLITLINMVTTSLFSALDQGKVKFRSIDPAKMVSALAETLTAMNPQDDPESKARNRNIVEVSEETKKRIRMVYGLSG